MTVGFCPTCGEPALGRIEEVDPRARRVGWRCRHCAWSGIIEQTYGGMVPS